MVFLGVSEQQAPKEERGLAERRAAAAATAASEGIREERRGERRNGGVRGGRPVGDGTLRQATEGGVSVEDDFDYWDGSGY